MRCTTRKRWSNPLALELVAGACLAALWAGSADARAVDERRPAAADARISVKNVNGTITVEGWSKKEVQVTGTIGEDVEELVIEGSESRLRIEVELPHRGHNSDTDADLQIKVPTGAEVQVDVVNCPIDVTKVDGTVELESVNGNVTVTGEPASVTASTVNGRISLTVSSKQVEAHTVNGRILLDGVSGDVSAATVGGSIEVSGGPFERGEFQTVSGDVDFTGALQGSGSFDFQAHSGDVILTLPANLSAEFDISTFSGDIDNAFGPSRPERKSRYGPGKELYFQTGGGKARVSINTFSGDVRLIKK